MKEFVKFPGFGIGAADVTIVSSRIMFWHEVSYNGDFGTKIYLDNGQFVQVGMYKCDVDRILSNE